MKAIIWTKYGSPDVLQLQDVPKPSPKEDELLIKIHATTVTAGDCEFRSLDFPFWLAVPIRLYAGLRKPHRIRILGQELAGEVEAVGSQVKKFQVGDPVYAIMGFKLGAYAEYICIPEDPAEMSGRVLPKPANLSYTEATAVPLGGLEALHFLQKGQVKPRDKVLINGAGGSIGTMGVQLANYFGAEVTAVDSGDKLDMLREIGAAHVIDYTQEDFTQNGQTYDVVFDVVGKSPFTRTMKALNENGRYLIANPSLTSRIRSKWTAGQHGKQIITEAASHSLEQFRLITELVKAGHLKPIIDQTFPLAQMAEAHRYVESGRKQGAVVITVVQA